MAAHRIPARREEFPGRHRCCPGNGFATFRYDLHSKNCLEFRSTALNRLSDVSLSALEFFCGLHPAQTSLEHDEAYCYAVA